MLSIKAAARIKRDAEFLVIRGMEDKSNFEATMDLFKKQVDTLIGKYLLKKAIIIIDIE